MNVLLYCGIIGCVSARILYNDKYLDLDKISANDTIYFPSIKVHVIYENHTNFQNYGAITSMNSDKVVENDSMKLYDDKHRVVEEFLRTTTSRSLDDNEEESEEVGGFDIRSLRFTTITCEVNGELGVCTPNSYYCRNLNGIVISVSGNNGGCGIIPCCQILLSCGTSSNKKISHFVNPADKVQASCDYTINVMNENVCQIRLDFLSFNIARPRQQADTTNTPLSCRDDALVINPTNGFRVPILCGFNDGQHMYLPVNASNGDKNVFLRMFLAIKRASFFPSPTWKIRVTQYECPNNPLASNQSPRHYRDFVNLAPQGCLQYFTNRVGTVCNFGFQSGLDYIHNYYTANMKYAICFKRQPSACGIKFTSTFFMLSSNNECTTGDYLFIPGAVVKNDDKTIMTNSRFCGNTLPQNAEILSYLEGPLYIQFESDNIGNDNEHGFCLDYETPPASGCV